MAADGIAGAMSIVDTAPKIEEQDQFWYYCFGKLVTERPPSMAGFSNIPFSAIIAVSTYYRLSEAETDFLIEYIGILDRWQIDQARQNQTEKQSDK
ncbi:hypothetical protein ASE85_03260 [Sphingobium sp. Leaf26]|uniref:hypothetical protein n=1 Tax=Sphingobium sp. Leaf26 TaxID=1735693 RepID=UPI000701047F|nr:hypothetical protein [Sphingobium sp. Leaf26]KQN09962.1 hypothetical protein ASE85_03260 [Sphingobium sp. Leaf26]